MSDSTDMLVAMRLADLGGTPIPGSTTIPCTACGEPCAVAPTGQDAIARGVEGPICLRCAPPEAFSADNVLRSLARKGVLREIFDELTGRRPGTRGR